MSKPISIGLVGGPGAGKAEVLRALLEINHDWFDERNTPLRLVRNPGLEISDLCDQAVGPYGSYREDLWTALKYIELEKYFSTMSYATGGTIISSLAHAAVGMEDAAIGVQTPETAELLQKYQMVISTLTMLWLENWRYDFVFYLPYPVESTPVDPVAYQHGKKVDMAIQGILGSFGMFGRLQQLKGEDAAARAEEIFTTITQLVGKLETRAEPAPTTD